MDEKDKLILKRLGEGKSQSELALELGISHQAVSVRIAKMKKQGIEIPDKSYKLTETDTIILTGLAERKSQHELATELGLSDSAISRRITRMRNNGIEIPTVVDEINSKILLGLGEGKSQRELAKELGLLDQNISQRVKKMKKQGIEIPDNSYEIDEKILEGLAQRKMQRQIAEELGVSQSTITFRIKKMRKYGIEIPDKSHKLTETDSINTIILTGLAEEKSQSELALELGISPQAVSERIAKMRRQGIEIPKRIPQKVKEQNKKIDRQLALGIINLIKTRHATIEQIKAIGDYYGVDIEEVLNSLDDIER